MSCETLNRTLAIIANEPELLCSCLPEASTAPITGQENMPGDD
tara:strand:- start:372 stop:500 length:129 start_codon:yes stop_codon:yes gene_type:complete